MLQMSFRNYRRPPLLAMDGGRVPPRALPAQRQAFLGVHAIKALFAHLPAFPAEHHQQPPISDPYPRLRHLAHPLPERREGISAAPVIHERPRGLHDATGPPLADRVAPVWVPEILAT